MNFLKLVQGFAAAVMLTVVATGAMAQSAQIDTVKNFYEAFNQNDPSLFDKVLAPNWEDIPANPGQELGREAFKPFVAGWNTVFKDLHITNDAFVESGDLVVVRSTLTGTQIGDFAGIPAKGKPINIMAVDIHQFENGLVVRTWHVEDWMRGLAQMGAFDQ